MPTPKQQRDLKGVSSYCFNAKNNKETQKECELIRSEKLLHQHQKQKRDSEGVRRLRRSEELLCRRRKQQTDTEGVRSFFADTNNSKETLKEWGGTPPTPKTTGELRRSEKQLRQCRKQQRDSEGVRRYCADNENNK